MGERRVTRKQFCFGAAVGLAGAPLLLASCGENLPEIERGKPIVEESKLKPNTAFTFADAETGEARVLVRLSDGEFALHSAECTHRGCTVEYKPEEGFLKCPCHGSRSEEHTSELQSRQYLVCRLLLEKKKENSAITETHQDG